MPTGPHHKSGAGISSPHAESLVAGTRAVQHLRQDGIAPGFRFLQQPGCFRGLSLGFDQFFPGVVHDWFLFELFSKNAKMFPAENNLAFLAFLALLEPKKQRAFCKTAKIAKIS